MSSSKEFPAALTAIAWLEWYKTKGKVITPGKRKNKYKLDQSFAVNHFALILDDDGDLFLAVREGDDLKWFMDLPWKQVLVVKKRSACLVLVCGRVTCPEVDELEFKGGNLPEFGIEIPIHSLLVSNFNPDSPIKLGTFNVDDDGQISMVDKMTEGIKVKIVGQ
jgi:hypothetical protein